MTARTVLWLNPTNGPGLLVPEAAGMDVFVHHGVIEGTGYGDLSEGHHVEFESEQGAEEPQATGVRPV